jgi:putative nucleotidyltransferase with HDIG domain/PAS domain S-box-containing protein
MYGYPRDFFIGKTPDILGAPGKNDLQSVVQAINKAFGGEPQAFEFWGIRADGEIFPKEVRLYQGTYFGQEVIIALSTDITERKNAEEHLRSMQAFLDHVLKAVPLGINVYNLETSKMEFDNAVNMSAQGMMGDGFNGRVPSERSKMIHLDDRETTVTFMQNLASIADGEVRELEFRIKYSDGEWHWFHYRYFVFERGISGKITKLLTVSEDITLRKQSEHALQRQLAELTSLHNIARSGIELNSIDELVELVTQEVGNSFYPDNFGALFLDETQNILRAHPSYRGIAPDVSPIANVDNSITGAVVMSGKPQRINNVLREPKYIQVTPDIRSELCVPIKIAERTIGVLNAESKQLDFFSDDDERLLLTIAGQMAIAIERIRLFDLERKRRREAETLRQATAALSTSLDLDHVLKSMLTSLKQVVPYDSASVFLLEDDRLRITIATGIETAEQIMTQKFPADDPLFMEVKNRREPLILANAQADTRFLKWGDTFDVLGWMGVPLITRSEVIGYITLDSHTENAYTQEAGWMAQAFANQAAAAIENARLFEGMHRSLKELNQAYESTIEGWSKAMDLRDKETEGHTLRVTEMTTELALALGIHGEALVHIRRGALLHDIGKMGVPDRILLKPDSLSDDEAILMRRHPSYAFDMLAPIGYLHSALDIPYCHHERWDGSGYPRGLKAEEIPLAARLFAVVDVWDALTSDRPYRPSWTGKEALDYIKDLSGVQFDPKIVEKFVELLELRTGKTHPHRLNRTNGI